MASKKVSVFVSAEQLRQLKKISTTQNTSVAHLIRLGVQRICNSNNRKQMKVSDALKKMRKKVDAHNLSNNEIEALALRAQKEVRHELQKRKTNCR